MKTKNGHVELSTCLDCKWEGPHTALQEGLNVLDEICPRCGSKCVEDLGDAPMTEDEVVDLQRQYSEACKRFFRAGRAIHEAEVEEAAARAECARLEQLLDYATPIQSGAP